MKRKVLFKFFVLAVIGAFVTVTSCKDYDDDIDNLEEKIAGLSSTLNDLKGKVDAGAVITKVESTSTGVKVTLSDGKTFDLTNGKDGAAGAPGAAGIDGAGSVVTAEDDGFWYINGVKTDKTWKGEKGDPGEPGDPGTGTPGKDGIYYEPNEDGYWYTVDGDVKTKTDAQWLLPGVITAVMNDYGDVTFHNVKSGDTTNTITFYNNKLLRSLVLIPDYYVNGIEAISFSPIRYESVCTEEIATIDPKVLVRYHVNPSSVTEDMIDTESLSFAYQLKENRTNYAFRSAEINPTVKFVSLDKGILTVEVEIDATKAESNYYYYWETMDMIALQVKLSDKALSSVPNAESIVTSDYGRVDLDDLYSPQIDRKEYLAPVDYLNYSEQYNTVGDAKEQLKPYLIEVKYDEQVDLIDYITSFVYPNNETELDLAKYGLKYKFDLIDTETGKPIVYRITETDNNTDQQQFIQVLDADKGTIKSTVYGQAEGTAAIGRTPLVRVQLYDTQNDCAVAFGYIKVKFVQQTGILEKEYAETVDFNCEETTIGPKEPWMNLNVYNPAELSSYQFHNNNYLDPNIYDANENHLPELGDIVDLWDAWYQGTVTELFKWNVSKDAINESATKVLTGYVYYRSREDHSISVKIKVTATINMPQLSVTGHNLTYWQNASYNLFKVNPIVYGNVEANPTANIYADLLNGFVDKNGKYTSDEKLIIKSNIAGFTPANVKFEFDETKLASYKYFIGTTEYSVAKENLKLSDAKDELLFVVGGDDVLAAKIEKATVNDKPVYRIVLDEDGTEVEANPNSIPLDPAKALVGKKVPVTITADLCGDGEVVQSVKSFEVTFIEPIKIDAKLSGSFTDAVIGGSKISVATALTFTDWNNNKVSESGTAPAPALYTYYELQKADWNIGEATTNLKLVDGNLVPTEGYKEGALPENYVVSFDEAANQLIFRNNAGTPISNEFVIYIPVSVAHKWGVATATVGVTVKKAAGTGN